MARGHDVVNAAQSEGNGIWAASLSASAPYAAHRSAVSLVRGSTPTWRTQLYGLQMPRTIIAGETSLPDPDAGRLPQQGVAVVIVPGAGHAMTVENPSGVVEALRAALL